MEGNMTRKPKCNLFNENAEAQLAWIDKYVEVQMIKNGCCTGFVHSIDPVSHSIIMLVPHEDRYKTLVIPGHAILQIIQQENVPADVKPPQRKLQNQVYSEEEIQKRKTKVIEWFKLNLLPVSEKDDKITIGDVNLLPPYKSMDLCTDNPIVALQIKQILEKMPEDTV